MMFLQGKQECIPVGCVPPAAVAVTGGGGSPHRCPGPDNPPGTRHLTGIGHPLVDRHTRVKT